MQRADVTLFGHLTSASINSDFRPSTNGDLVAQRLERWTCDHEVAGLTPDRVVIKCSAHGRVTVYGQINHLVI